MKARVVTLGSEAHRAAERLLPWYANGTLEGDEAAAVEAHLLECAQCRADLVWQRRLQAAAPEAFEILQSPNHASNATGGSGGATDAIAASQDAAAEVGWQRLRRELAPPRARFAIPARPPRWVAWAFAAQFAGLAAFAYLILTPPADAPYRALGAPAPNAGNVLVVFRPSATEAEVRAAVRAQGARVVGGPTATDAWLLEIPRERLAPALAGLRASSAVAQVESLEAADADNPSTRSVRPVGGTR